MQITDKDIQTFRERAKTELQSNGAVGRLAWDAVVNALCDEVEELRKNAAPGNAAALRVALNGVAAELETMNPRGWGGTLAAIRAALAAPARNCDRPFRLFEEAIGAYVTERGDGPHLGYCDAIKWALDPAEGSK